MSARTNTLAVSAKASLSRTKKPKIVRMPVNATDEGKPSTEEEVPAEPAAEDDDEDDAASPSGQGSDSSDSDSDADLEGFDGFDVQSLPTIAKDDATVRRKLEKAKRQPAADRGVIYLSRIPHGFYEDQMKAYFSQFGEVTRLRLSRNKKTGRSKHYGYVEFDSSSVAQIVAETMDNYLLMGHILSCKVVPNDEVHPELWVGSNRKWRVVPYDRVARVAHNKPRTEEEQEAAEQRLVKRQAARKRKIQNAGIQYDFDAVAYKKKPKV
ncbi:RNA-binding domain-containing protein [Auriscalpium vulgare]|uniref:RNA-binding domain-containing protein n=1 Tax=Auriscalpium vulgare TaxID=40419 RepID=A0ACB8RTR9_9AGAM|nr:RNA-binding domain-containing protein [Auriscalpium vulgare]